jgi:hypothetical protein
MSDSSLRHKPEMLQKEGLERLFENSSLSTFEMFRSFPVFTPRINLARFLLHYEIFKRVQNLPGSIIDLGVFHGGSTFTFAKLCEIFCPTDIKKTIYAFDTFSGFTSLSSQDGPEDKATGKVAGGYGVPNGLMDELEDAKKAMDHDRHLSGVERIKFIKGDVCETVPKFMREKEGLKIALLNLDLDLYEPTKVALEQFVPSMVKGGVIIIDQYADNNFSGETKAVDEYFLNTYGKLPTIQKETWHSNPAAFIVVE